MKTICAWAVWVLVFGVAAGSAQAAGVSVTTGAGAGLHHENFDAAATGAVSSFGGSYGSPANTMTITANIVGDLWDPTTFTITSGPDRALQIASGTILTIEFGLDQTYFGMQWTPLEEFAFGAVTFWDGGTQVAQFGSDAWDSALYANFTTAPGAKFDRVTIEAALYDGAIDDLAFGVRVAPTPLPAAFGMFGIAILGMGVLGMRRPS